MLRCDCSSASSWTNASGRCRGRSRPRSLRRLGRHVTARWIPADEPSHHTVVPRPGTDDRAQRILIGTIEHPLPTCAFDLQIAGLGAFPPSGRRASSGSASTLARESLTACTASWPHALQPIGITPERRALLSTPHDRAGQRRRAGRVRSSTARIASSGRGRCGRLPRRGRDAVPSHLSPKGATYEALLRVPLK